MRYVVGFNRDRDHYQVPLALAEKSALYKLVTDYFANDHWALPTLSHRRAAGITPDKTANVPSAFIVQLGWLAMQKAHIKAPMPRAVDTLIGRKIAKIADEDDRCGILAYAQYALPSFRKPRPQRILFKYHPDSSVIRAILSADQESHPHLLMRPEPEQRDAKKRDAEAQEEYHFSDKILCASTFTAKTVASSQISAAPKLATIPYGASAAGDNSDTSDRRASDICNFLFVGQGVQRKGLHYLLSAWRDERPENSRLTLVVNNSDPAILSTAPADVSIEHNLTNAKLGALMRQSDILVLPSLVEGFGLVLGEALASGCFLIATDHTGLPDYDLPSWAATTVSAGDARSLSKALADGANTVRTENELRSRIALLASERSWIAFRNGIQKALDLA